MNPPFKNVYQYMQSAVVMGKMHMQFIPRDEISPSSSMIQKWKHLLTVADYCKYYGLWEMDRVIVVTTAVWRLRVGSSPPPPLLLHPRPEERRESRRRSRQVLMRHLSAVCWTMHAYAQQLFETV
jgi:hypothetical protein